MKELSEVVERLEAAGAEFPARALAEFSQKIDRVMGAAKTLQAMDATHVGLERIGAMGELCKKLGYKAADSGKAALIPLFAAFWADTLEVLQELINALDRPEECEKIARAFSSVMQKRLEWLAGKLGGMENLQVGEIMKKFT